MSENGKSKPWQRLDEEFREYLEEYIGVDAEEFNGLHPCDRARLVQDLKHGQEAHERRLELMEQHSHSVTDGGAPRRTATTTTTTYVVRDGASEDDFASETEDRYDGTDDTDDLQERRSMHITHINAPRQAEDTKTDPQPRQHHESNSSTFHTEANPESKDVDEVDRNSLYTEVDVDDDEEIVSEAPSANLRKPDVDDGDDRHRHNDPPFPFPARSLKDRPLPEENWVLQPAIGTDSIPMSDIDKILRAFTDNLADKLRYPTRLHPSVFLGVRAPKNVRLVLQDVASSNGSSNRRYAANFDNHSMMELARIVFGTLVVDHGFCPTGTDRNVPSIVHNVLSNAFHYTPDETILAQTMLDYMYEYEDERRVPDDRPFGGYSALAFTEAEPQHPLPYLLCVYTDLTALVCCPRFCDGAEGPVPYACFRKKLGSTPKW